MLRLTLMARMSLIIVVSLTAVWIVAIAALYRVRGATVDAPSPAQISALAQLLETAPRPELVLAAVTTQWFRPRLAPVDEAVQDAGEPVALPQRFLYAAALAGRDVSLTPEPEALLGRVFPRLAAQGGLRFRIGLRTGAALIIDTRGPVALTRLGLPVGFGAGLFGTLVAVAALLIMQRETKPLARLAAAVDRVDLSSEPVTLPEARRSAPEIRAVMAAFARLQDRLGGMLRARMALIGGISHDVRTFATRLRLRIDGIPDPAERRRAETDIDDMIRLLDDALLSSRAGAGELAQEMVEIAGLIRADQTDRAARGERVTLRVDPAAETVIVLGDRLALRRIVGNLTDNALQYGHAARLGLGVYDGRAVLTVDDDGPGIPVGQRDMMFEPFGRLETSRSRATGGAGLGLAIVRTLVEGHGGTVAIGDAPGGGGRFSVALAVFTRGV